MELANGQQSAANSNGLLERVRVKYREKCSTVVTPALVEFGRISMAERDHIIPKSLLASVVNLYADSASGMVCKDTLRRKLRAPRVRTLILLADPQPSSNISSPGYVVESPSSDSNGSNDSNDGDDMGVGSELLAAITFRKDYSLTSSCILIIEFCAVAEDQRGRGLGSFLLKKLKSPNVGGSFSAIKARVPAINGRAIAFLLRNGFEEDAVLSIKFERAQHRPSMNHSSFLSSCGHRYQQQSDRSSTSSSTDSSRTDLSQLKLSLTNHHCDNQQLDTTTTSTPIIEPFDDLSCYYGRGSSNGQIREFFQLSPFVSPTARDLSGNCLSLRAIAADIEGWRAKSLEAYQEEVCLVLRLKSEVMRLSSLIREKDKQLKSLRNENCSLRNIIDSTNPFAAIAAIDQIDAVFANLKDVYARLSLE